MSYAGGKLRGDNRTKFCTSNVPCRREHARALKAIKNGEIYHPRQICSVCGGLLHKGNLYGICHRNAVCNSESARKQRCVKLGLHFEPRNKCAECGVFLDGKSRNKYCGTNPVCRIKYLKDDYARNKVKGLLSRLLGQAKNRAKRKEIPFDLKLSDLPTVPKYCPALGIEIKPGVGKVGPNSLSLDCIIPEAGYVPGNVQWLSFLANSMKRNATPDELRRFAEWILKN